MKKIQILFAGLIWMLLLSGARAGLGEQWDSVHVYYATYSWNAQVEIFLDVATMEGVYHGEYYQDGNLLNPGNMPNRVWTGPCNVPAPTITVRSYDEVGRENCPGMDAIIGKSDPKLWECDQLNLTIKVNGAVGGCPWIVGTRVNSWSIISRVRHDYYGPQTVVSDCPAIPLEPYDVSWNENFVVHNKVVRLQSTGGIIEQTLPTFLMKDGKVCDGSQLDERGAYCRFISQQMTFSASGCDNANVTVTPESHPTTDKQLHDMKLRVDTTSRQPIDSTCRFTYILNMY
ncbi:TPA: DUF2544 domain-containing protein [Escherichia coli]|uniref:StfH/YfcO family fimbrial adhesin n=1 Tax=Escherichia coli TaxID=562 RepID=UPI001BCAA2BC|nr:StfH/YfcO family fimbrial adhesin [Escherichia coli]MDF4184293.1 StfH/YfcO family fimbrial adhesin [Escherichia coli]HCP6342734.1 DUF2544 domain-containing protein [Escherichia coli]